jgi:uncharacterized protein (DUF2235 family)
VAADWILIFSDGTGQRGVPDGEGAERNSNVYRLYLRAKAAGYDCFYDQGIGAPENGEPEWLTWAYNLTAKATGLGIRANIAQCYSEIARRWRPGAKIGLIGFSRGAYTMRSLGGALATIGVAQVPKGLSAADVEARMAISKTATEIYAISPSKKPEERKTKAAKFRADYHCADEVANVIAVFDTVRALGLPGLLDAFNLLNNHIFHDSFLSPRVAYGLQALAIDEDRKVFKAERWDDSRETGLARVLKQVWFPGIHSDVGGGYDDDRRLADLSLNWMINELKAGPGIDLGNIISGGDELLRGRVHNERGGVLGWFYSVGYRTLEIMEGASGNDTLIAKLKLKFERDVPAYRPEALEDHPIASAWY